MLKNMGSKKYVNLNSKTVKEEVLSLGKVISESLEKRKVESHGQRASMRYHWFPCGPGPET